MRALEVIQFLETSCRNAQLPAALRWRRRSLRQDLLSIDGDDLRPLPLHLRKANLARLLARRVGGVQLAPFEQGEIGPDLFKAACNMGLDRIVSKLRESRYRLGRSPNWVKTKNPNSPAMNRPKDAFP